MACSLLLGEAVFPGGGIFGVGLGVRTRGGLVSHGQTTIFLQGAYRLQYKRPFLKA